MSLRSDRQSGQPQPLQAPRPYPRQRRSIDARGGGELLSLLGVAPLIVGALGLAALLFAYLVGLFSASSPPAALKSVFWPAIASTALGAGLISQTARPPGAGRRLAATVAGTSLVWALAAILLAYRPWSSTGDHRLGPAELCMLAAAAAGLLAAITMRLLPSQTWARAWWRAEPSRAGSRITLVEGWALAGVLGLFAIIITRTIAIGMLFGPDESAYAILARGLIEGTPLSGWSPHRAPLISFLAIPTLPFGDGEAAMRVVGLLSGVALLIGAWRLGRALGGPAVGVLAALVITGIPDLQLDSSFLLTDIPADAALVLLVLLIWRRFEVRAGEGSLLTIAAVAAAAFYFRYSSAVPIVLIGLTTLLVWPSRVIAAWRRLLIAGAMLLVLILPHVILALATTGRPWGIATLALDYAAPSHLGEALVAYLRAFPSHLAGRVAGAVMSVGVAAWLVRLAMRRAFDRTLRGATLLVLPALASASIVGITTLPQTRFLYFPISCLSIAGSVAIVDLLRRLPIRVRAMTTVPAVAILVAACLGPAVAQIQQQTAEAPRERYIALASAAIRADSGGSCSALTSLNAFVTWYARCTTADFGFPPEPGREALLNGPHRYLVLFAGFDPGGRGFAAVQPTGRLLTDYLRLVEEPPVVTIQDSVSGNSAKIYRFRSPAPSGRP